MCVGQLLVELRAKHFFGLPAVEVRRLADRAPHRLEHLAEERLADEVGVGLFSSRAPIELLLGACAAGLQRLDGAELSGIDLHG